MIPCATAGRPLHPGEMHVLNMLNCVVEEAFRVTGEACRQRSRVSEAVFAREQQIVIILPDSRSSSDNT